ncbi:hypothetical protein OAU51_00475 [Porticoccaceae bacterium]|nr:hypothetical protein [Porticoccaceae bacterium]
MTISRAMMRRQLRSQGGIMQLETRQPFIFGGIAKSVKKAAKGVSKGIKDLVSSDVGKMALLAAGTYKLGGGDFGALFRGGPTGFSFQNLPGAGLFAKGAPNIVDEVALTGGGLNIGKALGTGAAVLGGSALISSLFGSPQAAQEAYQRNPGMVKQYIKQYYKNINPDASDEEVETFATSQLGEYAAKQDLADGGRVGLADGTNYKFMELIDEDAEEEYYRKKAEELDRKYNPQNYNDIIPKEKPMDKYMLEEVMSERGINTLSEDTRDMAMKMYAEEAYRKGQISKEEYREIMGLKDGGMPTGIMRLNQAGVKERDYREDGGFVPVGIKEKADDVPAMLSKNEFVMTADAVRGAGNGDVEKGAQRMYKVMKTLENGGRI